MSFKQFLDEISYKHKKIKGNIKLSTYKQFCESSTMYKHDVKELKKVFHNGKGEVPILHENTEFYMLDITTGNIRPVKSRADKISVGVVLNGMIVESTDKKALESLQLSWDIPKEVYTINR